MEDVRIVDNKLMALTAAELAVLESILGTADRAGYDMAYYAMSGTLAVSLEARIASFSRPVGGVALAANRLINSE